MGMTLKLKIILGRSDTLQSMNMRCISIYLAPPFLCFLGPHLWHMEVPSLGVQLEPQLPAYTTATATSDLSCVLLMARPDP